MTWACAVPRAQRRAWQAAAAAAEQPGGAGLVQSVISGRSGDTVRRGLRPDRPVRYGLLRGSRGSVRLTATDWPIETDRRTRGRVRSWTRRSRLRLMESVSRAIFPAAAYVLITLTYPGEFSTTPSEWKRHLAVFRRRWERRYGGITAVWVMEFQRRGAAHFHLVVRCPDVPVPLLVRWVSRTWYVVVGSGDVRHYRAGTQVKPCSDWLGAARYLMSELGKYRQKMLPSYAEEGAGRWWGLWRLTRETYEVRLTCSAFYAIRRVLRRAARLKGWDFIPGRRNGLMVFDDGVAFGMFAQLIGWAEVSGVCARPPDQCWCS